MTDLPTRLGAAWKVSRSEVVRRALVLAAEGLEAEGRGGVMDDSAAYKRGFSDGYRRGLEEGRAETDRIRELRKARPDPSSACGSCRKVNVDDLTLQESTMRPMSVTATWLAEHVHEPLTIRNSVIHMDRRWEVPNGVSILDSEIRLYEGCGYTVGFAPDDPYSAALWWAPDHRGAVNGCIIIG